MVEAKGRMVQVVMSWGGTPQAMVVAQPGQRVRIGDAPDVAFVLPSEHVPYPLTLVEVDETGAALARVPAGAAVRVAPELEPALAAAPVERDGTRAIAIGPAGALDVDIGPFVFHVASVERERRVAPLARPDFASMRWVGLSLALHGAWLLSLLMMPPEAGALSLDGTSAQRDYVRVRLDAIAHERAQAPIEPAPLHETAGSSAPASAGDEGTAGHPEEVRRTGGGIRVRGEGDARLPTRERIASAAVIAAFRGAWAAAPVRSPYGAPEAVGFAPDEAYGALMADAAGLSAGTTGLGMIGVGRSGGCRPGEACGLGTVGVGRLRTGGLGVGTTCTADDFEAIERAQGHAAAVAACSGHGALASGLALGARRPSRVPRLECARGVDGQCATVAAGGLSREQIRLVVARNRGQIRACYEQALQTRPDLGGRVSVRWTILPDGRVLSADVQNGASDLDAPQVEQCVTRAIGRWQFPSSSSPTLVTYPFVFRTT